MTVRLFAPHSWWARLCLRPRRFTTPAADATAEIRRASSRSPSAASSGSEQVIIDRGDGHSTRRTPCRRSRACRWSVRLVTISNSRFASCLDGAPASLAPRPCAVNRDARRVNRIRFPSRCPSVSLSWWMRIPRGSAIGAAHTGDPVAPLAVSHLPARRPSLTMRSAADRDAWGSACPVKSRCGKGQPFPQRVLAALILRRRSSLCVPFQLLRRSCSAFMHCLAFGFFARPQWHSYLDSQIIRPTRYLTHDGLSVGSCP